ncbi:MAG TPA: glycosyltransferase family 4 protein [Firmicutes bacterium]|nr:glycosyltransferase family 4 protein [Candidatus Fermentithermobacillaceae bacterium]
MNIAMVSDSYYPYISGVTRAVSTLKETLTKMGHRVWLYCPAYPGAEDEEGVKRLPSLRSPTNAAYYVAIPPFSGMRKDMARIRPQVVHIHSPFNLSKAGYRAARRLNIPVVMTYHTMYNLYAHYVPLAGGRVSQTVERMAIGMANSVQAVVTPSSVIADYLRERGVRTPIFPIPNGIPVEDFQGGDPSYARQRYGIPSGIPVIISCGRLGIEKNVETLLRAFALVRARTDAALLLVGDGPLRAELEKLAHSLGIADRTFFAGAVPPDVMPHMYASADMFMFASLTDTQGLVLVEAKAAGLPAVAVGALGVKDMVADGEDGYLCGNDPEELAEKAVYLLENPSVLSRMQETARRNAQAFSREASASRILACYESVISG